MGQKYYEGQNNQGPIDCQEKGGKWSRFNDLTETGQETESKKKGWGDAENDLAKGWGGRRSNPRKVDPPEKDQGRAVGTGNHRKGGVTKT